MERRARTLCALRSKNATKQITALSTARQMKAQSLERVGEPLERRRRSVEVPEGPDPRSKQPKGLARVVLEALAYRLRS